MIQQLLKADGITMSQRKISRIMAMKGLKSKYGRKKCKNVYTDKETSEKYVSENYLKKLSEETKRTQMIWSMDFTEQKITGKTGNKKKMYTCGIIDINEKVVVGHMISSKCTAEVAAETLKMAIKAFGVPYMVHTDRGPQFTSNKFHDTILEAGVIHSMSRPHTPVDNVWIETFWKSMKIEIGYVEQYGEEEYRMVIDYYIHYYNTMRPHSALGYMVPLGYKVSRQINTVI